MAHALSKNKTDYEHMVKNIRCLLDFAIDADEHLIDEA
jgi:hypothetical protein